MWVLENRTPYAAERNWLRDKDGIHWWLVAVKAAFDFDTFGNLRLADEQAPPLLAPEHRGDPATTSLRVDSDLLVPRPGTDVLLDASAHAPGGRPASIVPVRLRVGAIEKTLVVHGPRVYYGGIAGLTTTPPRPFVVQPIVYEWAFGGVDTSHADPRKHRIDQRNPVGKGFSVVPDRLEHQLAHCIEYPSGDPAKVGPAGFGPIDRSWSPRLELAGTYDDRWARTRKPLLPEDYHEHFGFAAPVDQRSLQPLKGGETVTLVNLSAESPLRLTLPRLAFSFETRFGGRTETHGAALATVFIAPESKRLSMVWQSTLRVPARMVEQLDTTRVVEAAA